MRSFGVLLSLPPIDGKFGLYGYEPGIDSESKGEAGKHPAIGALSGFISYGMKFQSTLIDSLKREGEGRGRGAL